MFHASINNKKDFTLKNNKIFLFTLIFLVSTIQAIASEPNLPCWIKSYPAHPSMSAHIKNNLVLKMHCLESEKRKSTISPWYYVCQSDIDQTTAQLNLTFLGVHSNAALEIAKFGSFDVGQFKADVDGLSVPLHPTLAPMVKRLIQYHNDTPYIGTDSNGNNHSAGYFGGISLETLKLLDSIARVQETLPHEQKMKFLGVGSGGAYFEWLLSHVGDTTAMDVHDTREESDHLRDVLYRLTQNKPLVRDASKAIKQRDYEDLARRKELGNFFMPVTLYNLGEGADKSTSHTIINDVFKDIDAADYARTILVLCWPTEFANAYIQYFLAHGGKTILFIRAEDSDRGIFSAGYLGERTQNHPSKILETKLFRKTSLNLRTATLSTVDVYCRKNLKNPDELSPIEQAIQSGVLLLS